MDPFSAGVCMGESNAQIGRTLRSLREHGNASSQVARGVQDATTFNVNQKLPQHNPRNSDPGAGVANSQWTVMVWESQTPRLRLIDRVVSDCGAQAHWVEEFSDIERTACSSCCAAVIALGAFPRDDTLAAKIIGRMKQAGLTVIAHERGAHSWSRGPALPSLVGRRIVRT